MPNYKKHLFAGFATYSLLLYLLRCLNPNIYIATQWLICSLIGSLFPDIDTKSKIQKVTYTFLLIIFVLLTMHNMMQCLTILSLLAFCPLIVNHRGIFHKFWFILLIAFAIILMTQLYMPAHATNIGLSLIFFVAGAFSHLWLDLGLRRMLKI